VVAGDVMKTVLARLGVRAGIDKTRTLPLPGGDMPSLDATIAAAARATSDARNYGSRWTAVWAEIGMNGGREMLLDDPPYTIGEMRYGMQNEMASTLGDLLIRRTHLAFQTRDHGLGAAERVAKALGSGRDAIASYENEVNRVFAID
jgi:glycerol-3-phosphate dehydrogenase